MNQIQNLKAQDVTILLKVISLENRSVNWNTILLSRELLISQSEISEGLERCRFARLIDERKKHVHRQSVFEFVIYGVRFAFPVQPGPVTSGIPTAHSAKPLAEHFKSTEQYVWEDWEGTARGESIKPLYKTMSKAALLDGLFYELLALVDSIRIGRTREKQMAEKELKKRILNIEHDN